MPRRWPPLGTREIRLASGLVLAGFLLTHFTNHALGLISIEAMESGRRLFNLLWRNPAGTVLLYGALSVHFALALLALYRRRTLRMPVKEAAQLLIGLMLPALLIPHVVGTRVEYALTGYDSGYPDVVRGLWVTAPENGVRQVTVLVLAWFHMCLGLYFWLRARRWFTRAALGLYTAALLVPLLAVLGFAAAGKDMLQAPETFGASATPAAVAALLGDIRAALYGGLAGSILLVLCARIVRIYACRARQVRILYPAHQTVTVPRGFSVLEASRSAGIPHQSTCGGRGRCSTCRIRVVKGLGDQPPPAPQEAATLSRIKAGPDIRLACQLRPTEDLSVVPVLSAGRARTLDMVLDGQSAGGREHELAVLFCDLRGFTRLSEHRLPFDTVFILNRYFEIVGKAVEDTGGHLDKFIGDGALALFGLTTGSANASAKAFDAALLILGGIRRLNHAFASELETPLQAVVSLHAGPAVVGEMGYGQARGLTAVGDTINSASRLETIAKEQGAELVVSDELARRAGIDLSGCERRTVRVRGRAAPIDAWIIRETQRLDLGPPAGPDP